MSWWAVLLVCLASVIPLFFVWATLHELSHAAVVSFFIRVKKFTFCLYPHKRNGQLVFAYVSWEPEEEQVTWEQFAWVLFAPRWLNLLACIAFPFMFLIPGDWKVLWGIFWFGGLLDFANGSIGVGHMSDMATYASVWDISPWVFRVVGFSLIFASIISGFFLLFS